MPFSNSSILENKAIEHKINLRKASDAVLLNLYRETLIEIESFLDMGDVRNLTEKNVDIILDDVVSIIEGLRSIQSGGYRFARALAELRNARDELTVAQGLYVKGRSNPSQRFFSAISKCRKYLYNAISYWPHARALSGDPTTDAPPPEKKKKEKGK